MSKNRKEYIKQWQLNNKEKTRFYFRKWYENGGKEKLKIRRGKSTKDSPHRISLAKSIKKYPERQKARQILAYEIKKGNLKRLPCEKCGETEKIHAHHEDYSKPLEVIWLCSKHHKEIHFSV